MAGNGISQKTASVQNSANAAENKITEKKMTADGLKKIGKIVGFHGLKGDVKVRPSAPEAEWANTLDEVTLLLNGKQTRLSITHAKLHERLVLCRFEGYPDRTSVEAYMGAELWADEKDLAPLEEGEFYVDDIIGLNVLDHKTRSVLGTVNDLVSSGDQDYLEICHQQTRDKVLIPLNEHFVPEINADEKFITLDNLDGFFDDADRI